MKLNENGKLVLSRFLLRNQEGSILEKPEALLKRVSSNIAKEELKFGFNKKQVLELEKEFFKIMDNKDFMPNLPVLANAGRKLQQLAACFVLPVPDDITGIFEAVRDMAVIQKSGGGTGFSFSRLRPEGSYVSETGGIASGPVSFMKVFDSATGAIKEGGIRRGANMGILRVDHPDIEKFINSKERSNLPNFNISVALTDDFMKDVLKEDYFDLIFEKKAYATIPAKELFKKIAKRAWTNGEPGIVFIDEINKHNPLPKIGQIESTNPCGEVPLLPYESCILGSINLSNFITRNKKLDMKRLEKTVMTAVHFLDNCIDATLYPIPQIEKVVKANRKIGLGVMGFADSLIKLDIPYDSEKSEKFAEKTIKFIRECSVKASQELAKSRGAFPNISLSVYKKEKKPLRNATLTTIAPTGTISIIADCSEGIEPLFNLIFTRNSTYGLMYEINPFFRELIRKLKLAPQVIEKIAREGTLQNIPEIPEKIKQIFKTSHDISPEWHLRIQAAFQRHTDNAVSKTVNLPEKSTPEDIENIFLLAHKLKLKGLTVYRYNSRKEQVLEFCKKCELKM